jgi:4-oxalocrotonate tautomerase
MCETPIGPTMSPWQRIRPEENSMTLIHFKVIKGVLTGPQKRDVIERLRQAMVEVGRESMRRQIWCVVEEVASGDRGIGGRAITADDMRALVRS